MQNSTILITENSVSFLGQICFILDLLHKESKICNLIDFWLVFFTFFKVCRTLAINIVFISPVTLFFLVILVLGFKIALLGSVNSTRWMQGSFLLGV